MIIITASSNFKSVLIDFCSYARKLIWESLLWYIILLMTLLKQCSLTFIQRGLFESKELRFLLDLIVLEWQWGIENKIYIKYIKISFPNSSIYLSIWFHITLFFSIAEYV